MSKQVRAAVFPVAGRGTRFLPATKASPKEMLPIVDKPLIQYAVEEAVAAGATKLVFVTGSSKKAIEDHFDTDAELERALTESGKTELLNSIKGIVPDHVSCVYIRQGEPLGLGHAVLCARPAIGDEPFFVHLADDLIAGEPCLKELAEQHGQHGKSVIAVEEVPHKNTSSYGIVAVESSDQWTADDGDCRETEAPEDAPSNLAVVGRYLLAPGIWDKLENTGQGCGRRDPAHRRHRRPVWETPVSSRSPFCGRPATIAAASWATWRRRLPMVWLMMKLVRCSGIS